MNLNINLLLSMAYLQAAAPAAAEQPDMMMQMIPLALMLLVMIALLFIPAHKQRKEHENLVNSLQKGDKVLTSGGILGEVTALDNQGFVTLEIADKVKIKILKSQISGRYNEAKITETKADDTSAAKK